MKRSESTKKSKVQVLVGGGNRGARESLPFLAEIDRGSSATTLEVLFADPVAGRALARRDQAITLGMKAEAVEATVENVVRERNLGRAPIVFHLDRPEAVAAALLDENTVDAAVLAYFLVRLPDRKMWLLRITLAPRDLEARRLVIKLLARLGEYAPRRGSASMLGEGGDVAHAAMEGVLRRSVGEHLAENLPKLIAGTLPNAEPVEMTSDGTTVFPVLIKESPEWVDPLVLVEEIMKAPPMPVLRGQGFIVAELGPDAVRFHECKRRVIDGQFALNEQALVEPEPVLAASIEPWEVERATREATRARDTSTLFAVGMLSALLVTD